MIFLMDPFCHTVQYKRKKVKKQKLTEWLKILENTAKLLKMEAYQWSFIIEVNLLLKGTTPHGYFINTSPQNKVGAKQ